MLSKKRLILVWTFLIASMILGSNFWLIFFFTWLSFEYLYWLIFYVLAVGKCPKCKQIGSMYIDKKISQAIRCSRKSKGLRSWPEITYVVQLKKTCKKCKNEIYYSRYLDSWL